MEMKKKKNINNKQQTKHHQQKSSTSFLTLTKNSDIFNMGLVCSKGISQNQRPCWKGTYIVGVTFHTPTFLKNYMFPEVYFNTKFAFLTHGRMSNTRTLRASQLRVLFLGFNWALASLQGSMMNLKCVNMSMNF